jgi:hypothetical protein
MPKLALTAEQVFELGDALRCRLNDLDRKLKKFPRPDNDPDVVQVRHVQSVLSDILHLLEIA